ncbi:MAG: TraB/GumN family protein [Brevundimonas sp.]|uniref:TraB/GumN family protein n=1 Tax=Brevundimonas sp. TaxID=1871086 RepID=UPI0027372960|nr:TraB/GumN family protein [Brevundimonas sp.]MDP3406031.1 TraB/GumN family protein [Brevundimonas sp.]
MTFANRLKSTTVAAGRAALGSLLGLGLAAALLASAPDAFAQTAAPAAASSIPVAEGDGPALWVVSDADSTIYLYGTIHLLRPTTAWGSARVDRAFDSASEVWFEVQDPDDQSALGPIVQRLGVSPDRPLSSLLTAEEFAALDAAARGLGASGAQLDPLRPWLASLQLAVAGILKAGFDPQAGVDRVLIARAKAAGKPVKGLETLQEQIGFIANLSEETQLDMLRSSLEDFAEAETLLDQMSTAWATGDVAGLDRLVVAETRAESPELYEAIFVRRNRNWADQIQTLLAGSGTIFIAVGSGHLAGDESVQEILEDRGVTVTRQ